MRLRRFFASAAFLLASTAAFCCGPYWFMPEEYYMYRVYDKGDSKRHNTEIDRNCQAWQRVTSSGIGLEDIREVVYKYNIEQTRDILSSRKTGNSFADWIKAHKDTEIVDFLVLAKTCEEARAEMYDPWYYPSKDDPTMATLKEVVKTAEAYKGTRLEDRYVLQAARALTTLEEYRKLDSLWQSREAHINDGVIREMILGYVAGAAYNLGDVQKALDHYTANNDLQSIALYLGKLGKDNSTKSILEYAAEHCPDSPQVPEILQSLFYGIEPTGSFYYHNTEDGNFPDYKVRSHMCRTYEPEMMEEYVNICMKAASKAYEAGIWYYTAAYLKDLLGQPEEAMKLAGKAASSSKSVFIGESIKVLQMYLDAKTAKYDSNYENRLLAQLRWLDGKVQENLTPQVRKTTEEGYRLHIGVSYCYWNDMLRRIVISEVCPRMEDEGKAVTALALLNMADNRLLSLVGRHEVYYHDNKTGEFVTKSMPLEDYRRSKYFNMFDYSNYYFEALDGIDVKHLERYARILTSGGDNALEQFALARGFKDIDYVNEVIGTRYLRDRNYTKAASMLAKVSPSYEHRLNLTPYFDREPFCYGFSNEHTDANYKLSFAREMQKLENDMKSTNLDIKGEAMVKYGIGLRSSFDYCWTLTHYHMNEGESWLTSKYRLAALEDAERYMEDGLATIQDKELAAQANLSLCRWLTVAEKYSDTETGKRVISQCDKLYDHIPGKQWSPIENE